jgi:hypothetical protein
VGRFPVLNKEIAWGLWGTDDVEHESINKISFGLELLKKIYLLFNSFRAGSPIPAVFLTRVVRRLDTNVLELVCMCLFQFYFAMIAFCTISVEEPATDFDHFFYAAYNAAIL